MIKADFSFTFVYSQIHSNLIQLAITFLELFPILVHKEKELICLICLLCGIFNLKRILPQIFKKFLEISNSDEAT